MSRTVTVRSAGWMHAALLTVCVYPSMAAAQQALPAGAQPAPQADPKEFGLLLPDAPPRPGLGRRVQVENDAGKQVVAKIYVEVGDRRVLWMPDGRLTSVPADKTTLTEDPFKPATKEEIIAQLTATKFKGFKSRSTARYLYVYNTSEPFYQATSRILETMYPSLVAFFKRHLGEVQESDVPLVIIMFRTEEEFQLYRAMPEGVAAYYDSISNHVVMYEQSKLGEVAPELAVKQSISVIAHEGVHQILHNIGVQKRLSRWPIWISEGLAEYFAPTSVEKRLRWKGVGQVNDLRMAELEKYLKAQAAEPGDTLQKTVETHNLTSAGYASAWALTHYLAQKREKEFIAYLREISPRGPLEADGLESLEERKPGNLDLFMRHFGKDLAAIEKAMIQHLQKLPYVDPIANQTHYVVMTILNTGATIQKRVGITTSPTAVKRWQDELLLEVPLAARPGVAFRVQSFPSKTAADKFADGWLNSPN